MLLLFQQMFSRDSLCQLKRVSPSKLSSNLSFTSTPAPARSHKSEKSWALNVQECEGMDLNPFCVKGWRTVLQGLEWERVLGQHGFSPWTELLEHFTGINVLKIDLAGALCSWQHKVCSQKDQDMVRENLHKWWRCCCKSPANAYSALQHLLHTVL